jgi:hypothetical protein
VQLSPDEFDDRSELIDNAADLLNLIEARSGAQRSRSS